LDKSLAPRRKLESIATSSAPLAGVIHSRWYHLFTSPSVEKLAPCAGGFVTGWPYDPLVANLFKFVVEKGVQFVLYTTHAGTPAARECHVFLLASLSYLSCAVDDFINQIAPSCSLTEVGQETERPQTNKQKADIHRNGASCIYSHFGKWY
jgi:hypothetical protein